MEHKKPDIRQDKSNVHSGSSIGLPDSKIVQKTGGKSKKLNSLTIEIVMHGCLRRAIEQVFGQIFLVDYYPFGS